MKQIHFSNPISVFVLRLGIGALLIMGAIPCIDAAEIFATSAANGGRLYLQRSPTLGDNVALTISIDGTQAGTLSRGRTYDRYLTPGRHVLVVSPNRSRGPSQTTLEVHRGHTYAYSVSSTANKLVLTPMSAPH